MNKKLVELDSLRALMAFAVFISHVQFLSGAEIWAFPLGGVAVTVFVILSGFAITRSLMGSGATYWQYLGRRFWRIYPVYAIGLALGLCTSWMQPALFHDLGWVHPPSVERIVQRVAGEHQFAVQHLLAHLTLLHGAVPDQVLYGSSLAYNSVAWSLSLEWQFYLVAPALLWLIVWTMRRPIVVRIPVLVIGAVLLAMGKSYFAPFFTQVDSFLPMQLCFFVLGMFTAVYLERITEHLWVYSIAVMALAVFLGGLRNVIPLSIWTLTIITSAHTAPRVLMPVRRFLTTAWLVRAGEASYSFYMIHLPILLVTAQVMRRLMPHMTSRHGFELILASITILPTCALALLLFVKVETPINAWAKAKFRGRKLADVAKA